VLPALPYKRTPVLTRGSRDEVLSPDDKPGEILHNMTGCTAAGIPYVRIGDPYKRTLVAVEQGGDPARFSGQVMETRLAGQMDFATLFQRLHEPAE